MTSKDEGIAATRQEIKSLVNDARDGSQQRDKGPPWWRSQRFILAYFLFAGMMNIFFQRIDLSIAIVCMVNHTAINPHSLLTPNSNKTLNNNIVPAINFSTVKQLEDLLLFVKNETFIFHKTKHFDEFNERRNIEGNFSGFSERTNSIPENLKSETDLKITTIASVNDNGLINYRNTSSRGCGLGECGDDLTERQAVMKDGPLVWDKELQGILLGAVYWTYLLVQIPANLLVRKAKKKTVIVWSMLVMTAMTMLMHMAALWSPWAVFAVRLVQGACTALAVITVYGMLGRWAPPSERGSLITLAMTGQNMGSIIGFPLSAVLCEYGFLGGWPSIFYVFGSIGFIWIVLFYFFTDDLPTTHRFITDKERKYITSSLSHSSQTRHTKVPWAAIMTSPPFWAIVIGQFSYTWGLLLILSTLPQYMLEVLQFDIKSNGVFTMLPYIALLFVTLAAGSISDWVIRRKMISVLWTRRLCVLVANLVPAVLLAAMSFLDSSQAALAITLLVLAVGASGFSLSGFMVNPYDIAPRYATELMVIINTAATIPGILSSYIVAAVTKDQTREQWQIVFFLTSGIYVLGTLVFCVLAQGVVQPWSLDEGLFVIKVGSEDTDEEKMSAKEKEIMLNDC